MPVFHQFLSCECTGSKCQHRTARPVARGNTTPQGPCQRGPKALGAGGLAALLLTAVILSITPVSGANEGIPTETFEGLPTLSPPPNTRGYTFTSTGNTFVSDALAHNGEQSLRSVNGGANFNYGGSTGMCGIGSVTFWVNYDIQPTNTLAHGGGSVQILAPFGGPTQPIFIRTLSSGGNNDQATGIVMPTDTWVDFTINYSGNTFCGGAAGNTVLVQSNVLQFSYQVGFLGTPQSSLNTGNANFGISSTNTATIFVDDITVAAPLPLQSNQVAVTNLVGGSMNADGSNIVARTNGGATVRTYGTTDMTEIANVATGCSRTDGVVSTTLNGDTWITYASCTNPAIVDTLHIRDGNLGAVVFPNDCEGFPERDVENTASVDVPDNAAQLGTLSDLSFDYEECVNPTGPSIGSFASWTFSSNVDGWIGAFGVVYGQNSVGDDQSYSREEHASVIDTSAAPKQVDDFCSWRGPDGNDYIGGVSQDGVAAVYQVLRSVSVSTTGGPAPDSIDFGFVQKFRNAGPYAGSNSIACAQDMVAIQTPTEIRILANITTTPFLYDTIPNVYSASRGLAFAGSGEFLMFKTPTNIKAYDTTTKNITGQFATPSGTWIQIESDFAGQRTAVFTSTFITVIQTAPITCETHENCEEFGGIGDDQTGPGPGPTTTTGPGGQDFGENIEDNVYFWVIVWILIVVIGLALLSWGTRAGFSGLVYIIGVAMVYIAAILLNNYDGGTTNVSPWPVAAMAAISIGLAITWWARR